MAIERAIRCTAPLMSDVVGAADEAARDDLGRADEVAGLAVDGHDHEEHAVLRERAAVADDDVADLPDRDAVDIDVASLDPIAAPSRAVGRDLDRLAVLEDEDALGRDPDLLRDPAVLDEHPELAVDRDEVPRTCQVEHELQLLLARVPRHVGVADRVVEDVRAILEEVVDRPCDHLLVARDRAGADDDGVAGADLDVAVVAVGHPRESRHRLALGAGRRDRQPLVGDVLDAVLRDEARGRRREVPELGRDLRVLLHRAPDDRDLAPERLGCVEDLLDARDVRGERGHDDPTVEPFHDVAEGFADRPLRRGVAGRLGSRRVGQEAAGRPPRRSARAAGSRRVARRPACGRT